MFWLPPAHLRRTDCCSPCTPSLQVECLSTGQPFLALPFALLFPKAVSCSVPLFDTRIRTVLVSCGEEAVAGAAHHYRSWSTHCRHKCLTQSAGTERLSFLGTTGALPNWIADSVEWMGPFNCHCDSSNADFSWLCTVITALLLLLLFSTLSMLGSLTPSLLLFSHLSPDQHLPSTTWHTAAVVLLFMPCSPLLHCKTPKKEQQVKWSCRKLIFNRHYSLDNGRTHFQ